MAESKSEEEIVAWEIVNGFFIGGGGDTLENPNLTKYDLASAIAHHLAQSRRAPAPEAEAVVEAWRRVWALTPGTYDNQTISQEMGAALDAMDDAISAMDAAFPKEDK